MNAHNPAGNPAALPRRAILALCCLSMVAISFFGGPIVCATAIAGDLGMGLAEQGVFLSTMGWGLTVAILVVGPLPDRLGFRALMVLGACLQGAGLLLISRAASAAEAYAGGVVFGAGSGVADAILTPIVCAVYPERRARATALLHSFYAIGLVGTVLIVLGVLEAGWHWRGVLTLLAALVAPYGVLAMLLPLPGRSHEGAVRMPTRQVVRRGAFWLLLAAILLSGVTELGPSSWLPAFVEQAAAGSRRAGALGLLAFGVTMAAGRLAVSASVHRTGARGMFLAGGAVCVASLAMASLPWGAAWSAAWLAVLGLGVAGFWPTILACAGDRFPQAGASMFSLLAAAGNSGGIVAPIAIGFVGEHAGLHAAMRMLVLAPVAVVALTWFVMGRGRPAAPGEG